jgi:type II secretory pathway pseudopilin PulG
MRRHARGFLLLPVALTLVVVGALAYAMTRDAGMSVARVDAAYDTEVARYLAEAAMNLARSKNNTNCPSNAASFPVTNLYRYSLASGDIGTTPADQVGTMTANSLSVVSNNSNSDKGSLIADVSGTTTTSPAASLRILRTVSRYDLSNLKTVALTGGGGANTFIYNAGSPAPQGSTTYLELTDNGPGDQSYGLVRFSFSTIQKNALVKDATLRLKRNEGESTALSNRKLDLYRLTSTWDPASATWSVPWVRPGGDYPATPVASSPINDNSYYTWRLDGLVAGWVDGTTPNNGVLLKPTGLIDSRFSAFTNSDGNGPQLTVNYYERCN